jgi:type III pantothenate kinase
MRQWRIQMLLAIDAGNTHIVIGVWNKEKIVASWRIGSQSYETADEIGSVIISFLGNAQYQKEEIDKIIVSSVVPSVTEEVKKMCAKYFRLDPVIVSNKIDTGLKIVYDYPQEVGSDRIANAVAAKELYGNPAIVVDFGTATTFDVLSAEGSYIGGVIVPGIEISSEALFKKASKLSKVDLYWPKDIIGSNTNDCIRSGILYGSLGTVDFIIKKILEYGKKEMDQKNTKIIATGGLSSVISPKSEYITIIDPLLTLKGLKILSDRNSKDAKY